MKKEKLIRLKALLLAITMCLTFNGCAKKNQESETKEDAIVIFIEGKALIYSGEYNSSVHDVYTAIWKNKLNADAITLISSGTDAIEVKSMEDAVELATAIVGEENIIYIDYKDEDMQLTYTKKNK